MSGSSHRRIMVPAAVCVLFLSLLWVRSWKIDYPYSIDFQAYWLAGERVAAGDAGDLYAPGGGPGHGTPRAMPANEFKNIPIVAALFAPLAAFEYEEAKRIFWWISLVALAVSAVLIGARVLPGERGDPVTRSLWMMAFLFAMAPAHTSLRHGQTTPLVLLALCGCLAASHRGRHVTAGILLALACVVKLPLLAIPCLDLLRARWRRLGATAATLAVVVALSYFFFGPVLHRQYAEGITQHAGTVMTGHNNQSIVAVVARLAENVPVNDWEPRPVSAPVLMWTAVLTLLLTALVAAGIFRNAAPFRPGPDRRRSRLEFASVLALGLVVLPVAWDHYFLLLAPAVAFLAVAAGEGAFRNRTIAVFAVALAAASITLPTPTGTLERSAEIGWPAMVAISHYFLGAVLILGLAVLARYERSGR